jgi:hypothetical protein
MMVLAFHYHVVPRSVAVTTSIGFLTYPTAPLPPQTPFACFLTYIALFIFLLGFFRKSNYSVNVQFVVDPDARVRYWFGGVRPWFNS